MTPANPFDRIPDTSCEYEGTVLELPRERHHRLAADPAPPQEG